MSSQKRQSTKKSAHRIHPQSIVEEMKQSYLDYAMSVIVSRALPDVRDGLKPVHRRILYAMWDIGLKANAKLRKSATVVGEVLGKYHPHGDVAVYDSLVRLAQDFSMRYPLIQGQGNFGSIDGDAPAAMRYTEAKLSKISEELLIDLEKDTVDWHDNYDNSQKEPRPLPAKLPNLLLNGTLGIAVGMATNIPPHNIGELCDSINHLIDNPEATIEDLMQFIKGPDFPTGGIVYDINDIKQAYATGKGGVVVRAKAVIQEDKQGSFQIVVTEIPFQVNKATLIERIAGLVKDKKIKDIKGLRDESDKDGMRIVIELKKDSYPKKILNQLYKFTQLQDKFHFNMLALIDGIQPRVLTLKMILTEHIKHRQDVITRRTKFELKKTENRAHILKGIVLALENIDAIIQTIKKSKNKEQAKINLIKKFKLSKQQSQAILEMKLQQLANMERLMVEKELEEKKALIKKLKAVLKDKKKILKIIKDDLIEIKEKYQDERRSKIVAKAVDSFSQEDLIPQESTIVVITKDGYIKRLPPNIFKAQGRGGKGVLGLTTKEQDTVSELITTDTHSDLLFFTTSGKILKLKAYDIPQTSRAAKGQALVNFLQITKQEKVSSVLALADLENYQYLVMVTKKGLMKKVNVKSFEKVRASGLIAINLKADDLLKWVKPSTSQDEIMLITASGQAIRFKEKNIRAMGRTAAGVRGMRLKAEDYVVGMAVIAETAKNSSLLVVTEQGLGKRTALKNYKVQGRGGSGIKTAKITEKTGNLVEALLVSDEDLLRDLIIISQKGQVIRMSLKSVSILGRATQGVKLMKSKAEGDKVASVIII